MKNSHATVIGTISTTQKGAGFVDLPEVAGSKRSKAAIKEDSIYIDVGNLKTALNGDKVEVRLKSASRNTEKKREGEVLRVLERAKKNYVAVIKFEKNQCLALPDDRKMYTNILLPKEEAGKVKEDDKVYLSLLPWTDPNQLPQGKVIRILGKKGLNDVEMESIVLESGFEVGFPEAVEREAEAIGQAEKTISKEEVARRRDFRNVLTFTIDPFDAKDFDDAISFRALSPGKVDEMEHAETSHLIENIQSNTATSINSSNVFAAISNNVTDNSDTLKENSKLNQTHTSKHYKASGDSNSSQLYEIGVHIADVSHYVREGTALDKEAVKRGCSIYLVDRTIPMLPEILSNELCSLKPHEDKLCFSAVFKIDEAGRIKDRWFGKTIINSTYRFTYETAQAAIEGTIDNMDKYSNGFQKKEDALPALKYSNELVVLNKIAKILQKEKFSKGAIEFEQEEIKFKLDENGKPIGVYTKERFDAHKLVEEYMLLANREVAKYIFDSIKRKGRKDTGSIYRIHDVPDREKITDLSLFVKALGYDLKTKDGEVTAKDFNNLLNQIEDTPHESLVRTAAIRSMQKAVYSTKNIGHFGLAFDFYTHFTSPIRRYPDLLVHRILHKHLRNEPFKDTEFAILDKIAASSTEREIDAADAERSSKKLKQVEYMSSRIGQTFTGTISGVTKWGLYVEEDGTKSEGMIGFRNLGDDYFNFDPKTYSALGEKSGKKYTLGDKITFKVLSADLDKKTLDFGLVGRL